MTTRTVDLITLDDGTEWVRVGPNTLRRLMPEENQTPVEPFTVPVPWYPLPWYPLPPVLSVPEIDTSTPSGSLWWRLSDHPGVSS